ncbi:MAG: metal ABC transporter substrate-binding protein [bacterium]
MLKSNKVCLTIAISFFAFLFFCHPVFSLVRVVTTTTDLAAITQEVGKDKVQVESLSRGNQDPHFVDPKPSFMVKLQKADLLIVVGLDLEIGYIQPLIDGSRNPKIRKGGAGYMDASAGCEILQIPNVKVERSMGDIHIYGNPHYWLDPVNGKVIAKNIAVALSRVDPANAGFYSENAKSFGKRIDEKLEEWKKKLAPCKGAEIITYHNSWPNFARRFGIVVAGHVEPKPGIPPTPSHTVSVISTIKEIGIKAIVVEPYFDKKAPNAIASKTGAKVLVLPPSVGGVQGTDDYFALFDYIVSQLASALGG